MSELIEVVGTTKEAKYESLIPQLNSLVEGETDLIANLANIVSALKYGMNFFWVGIYFVKASAIKSTDNQPQQELVLGPFQGPVACTRIKFGKGVCGMAWQKKQSLVVQDVNNFPGHIACSSESKSEIVVPCFNKNEVIAILDIDSDKLNDFDDIDKKNIEAIVKIIERIYVV